MHRNENKYDQIFRNRLRDISHPVRDELWSRIHSGISVRKPSVPNPGTALPLLGSAARSRVLFSATSLTVAAAAILAISLGIIHYTHTTTKPSAQPVNHYSTIAPAKAPAGSTGESSVTSRDSSRDRTNESATPSNPRTTLPLLSSAGTPSIPPTEHPLLSSAVPTASSSNGLLSNGLSRVPDAAGVSGTTSTSANSTPENTATTARRHHTSAAPETISGIPGMEETAATPGKQTPGNQIMGKLSLDRHNHNPVILPALAHTSSRTPISAGSPGSKYRRNGSNDPGNWPAPPPFKRTGYVSLYASPDFPNHYYTWSYTLGGRLTFQFSRRWSFTAGFEYARVNVPTQVVPPIGYGDTLHSFYFSNYEVPVLFGYTRNFRHSTLTVNGGVIFNLYFHQSTSAWVFNWPDRDSYGAVLGVDYSYPLGRHLALFAQPYARYSISDYRMFIQAQRWSFGTLLGIKYQL